MRPHFVRFPIISGLVNPTMFVRSTPKHPVDSASNDVPVASPNFGSYTEDEGLYAGLC